MLYLSTLSNMIGKESRGINIDKVKKAVINAVAPVVITPVLAIGIQESIIDVAHDDTIVTPQAQNRIYDNETLVQKYAQIVWDSKHAIIQPMPDNTDLNLSPDQLSLGTKIAVAVGLLSLLSYSVAKSSEFAKYADTHQKYAMWTAVGLQATASLVFIIEAFK